MLALSAAKPEARVAAQHGPLGEAEQGEPHFQRRRESWQPSPALLAMRPATNKQKHQPERQRCTPRNTRLAGEMFWANHRQDDIADGALGADA